MAMKTLETPNLPFHFKRLSTFLKVAKVAPAQQKELELARDALTEIFKIIFNDADPMNCTAQRPQVPHGF